MANTTPWTDYAAAPRTASGAWDCNNYPFVVRWTVSCSDRLTRWISMNREFRTLEEAVAAYKRSFRGLSVDLVAYNGKQPGKHLDYLAERKAGKPTKWGDLIPSELRAA